MLIRTKFIGPTDKRGARVKATSGSGVSVTIGWSDEESIDENHITAAYLLSVKLVNEGRQEPKLWARRWDRDGICIHVGLYEAELNKDNGQ